MSAYVTPDNHFTSLIPSYKSAGMRKVYLPSATPAALANGDESGRSLLPQEPKLGPGSPWQGSPRAPLVGDGWKSPMWVRVRDGGAVSEGSHSSIRPQGWSYPWVGVIPYILAIPYMSGQAGLEGVWAAWPGGKPPCLHQGDGSDDLQGLFQPLTIQEPTILWEQSFLCMGTEPGRAL